MLNPYRGYSIEMLDEPTPPGIYRFSFTARATSSSSLPSFKRILEITNRLAGARHINPLRYLREQGEHWVHRIIDLILDANVRHIAAVSSWRSDIATGPVDFSSLTDERLRAIDHIAGQMDSQTDL